MKNRLGLIFLGDRRTAVGRGVRVRRQRRRSSADAASHSSPTEPKSPTTSASPTSPSDAATAEATAAMTELLRVLDELRTDPASDLKKLETVATSAQLNAVQTLVRPTAGAGPAPDRHDRHQRAEGPVGQPRQLRPGRRQGAHGRHRRLLGRQQGRRARQERQVDRLPRPPGHRVDALHRRELRLRRRSDRWLARGDGPGPQEDAMRGILIRLLLDCAVRRRLHRPCPRRRRTPTPCAQQTDPATGECLIWIEVPGTPGYAG